MLLWIRNLRFKGSEVVFLVSGAIPIQYEAVITAQYEATIPVNYEAEIIVQTEAKVSI